MAPDGESTGRRFGGGRHNAIGILLAVLVLGLFYTNQFDHREESIKNCELRNMQIREVNKRAQPINILLRIESAEPEHAEEFIGLRRSKVEKVPLIDCPTEFDKPWPFG